MSSADSLTTSARVFYEQTRFKMVVSIFLGSMAMMSLAYVSSYGGESNSANFLKNKYDNLDDDHLERAQEALAGGYGNILHLCTEKNIFLYLIFIIFRICGVHVLCCIFCVLNWCYLCFSDVLWLSQ